LTLCGDLRFQRLILPSALLCAIKSRFLTRPLFISIAGHHECIRLRAALAVMAPKLVVRSWRMASGRDGFGSGCAAIQASRIAS